MQCNAGMVRLGYAQFGPSWHGRLGSDWLCSARLGIARLVRRCSGGSSMLCDEVHCAEMQGTLSGSSAAPERGLFNFPQLAGGFNRPKNKGTKQ